VFQLENTDARSVGDPKDFFSDWDPVFQTDSDLAPLGFGFRSESKLTLKTEFTIKIANIFFVFMNRTTKF